MIQAGKLDRRVTVERATATAGPFNEPVETWSPLLTNVSAAKTDIRDGERFRAGEVMADATTRFLLRWNTLSGTIDARDRLVCEGRTYSIVGVKEVGRREGVEITTASRVER